jgi:hypothetical protein
MQLLILNEKSQINQLKSLVSPEKSVKSFAAILRNKDVCIFIDGSKWANQNRFRAAAMGEFVLLRQETASLRQQLSSSRHVVT